MFTLGVILARAGSKGLPNKCMRSVLGRPMIEWTFDHALAARRLTTVLLTTDSEPAQMAAREHGVSVVDRPAALATDTARVDAAARHAIERFERASGVHIDAAVLLYANIPVRAAGVIDRAVELLQSSGADSVRTVAPVGKHHPDWLHRVDESGAMRQYRENSISRRQDLEPLYYHDGAVIAVTRAALFAPVACGGDGQAFLGTDRRALIQQPEDAVDVDAPLDLAIAEAVLRVRQEGVAWKS